MLRNYLAAALRNLFRNRAYAAINICGLALGFAAVMLIALYVRDEYSYDRFFPANDRVYLVTETVRLPGEAPLRITVTASNIAPAMKLDFSEVEIATRLSPSTAVLRQGDIQRSMKVYWADPSFFSVFPMKIIAGDPAAALREPNGIVLTRATACRFFGRDAVLGKSIELDRQHVMQVTAVIEDLPANTHMDAEVFVPSIASFSRVTVDEMGAKPGKLRPEDSYTYVRLRPDARAASLSAAMRGFAQRHVTGEFAGEPVAKASTFNLVPLAQIHLQPRSIADMKPPGDPRTLQAMIGIAVLILFVAGSNFVSMMTARSAQRAVEVGVRKAVGATRRQIIAQFMGECLFYAALALLLAILAVEMAMPALNGFLQRDMAFNYLDPSLGAGILAVWVVVGLAAGAYPALVLSMFRPSAVLKGIVYLPGGSGRLRQTLVICQFGTLIALIVSTITIHRQTLYAMENRLRLPTEQIYVASSGCPAPFREAVVRIQGVLSASCASDSALAYGRFSAGFAAQNGGNVSLAAAPVDYGFLELFGVKPLAGRLFAPDRGEDDVLCTNPASESNPSVVINETAARALGYASPQAAVNQFRRWSRMVDMRLTANLSSQIIGVIPAADSGRRAR